MGVGDAGSQAPRKAVPLWMEVPLNEAVTEDGKPLSGTRVQGRPTGYVAFRQGFHMGVASGQRQQSALRYRFGCC